MTPWMRGGEFVRTNRLWSAMWRAMAGAVATAVLALGTGGSPAHADTVDPAGWPAPRIISYNAAGGHPLKITPAAWTDTITQAMDYWDTDLIMFQEMCYGQWTRLRDSLADRATTPYDSVWAAAKGSTSTPSCSQWGSSNLSFGLAIFAKGASSIDLDTRTVYQLPEQLSKLVDVNRARCPSSRRAAPKSRTPEGRRSSPRRAWRSSRLRTWRPCPAMCRRRSILRSG